MKYKYDSKIVAKFLLALAYKKGIVLNITKVQKLLYIAYGSYLYFKNECLLNEQPQAWPSGPVFPYTRDEFIFSKVWDANTDEELFLINENKYLEKLLNKIIENYSHYSGNILSEWSKTTMPWIKTTKNKLKNFGKPIKNKLIKKYFETAFLQKSF